MQKNWEIDIRSQLQANHEMLQEANTSWNEKVLLIFFSKILHYIYYLNNF